MTGSAPRFTVIIPVYNGEALIGGAIESCLQQTVLPDQIIVIDDASTDGTEMVVQSVASSLIRYEKNENNNGPSFSRNRGIQYVDSGWVLFLDADDFFHSQKIEIIRDCIQKNAGIRAMGHSFAVGKNVPFFVPESIPSIRQLATRDVLLKNPVVTPALCIRADNHILFNETMHYAEDHDFILRTAERYGFYFLDLPLCSLQRRPLTTGGISSDKWKMRKGEMKMYMDYCKRNKWYPAIPFLLLFSLVKHARQIMALK